jgi:hypothetical protein
MAVNDEVTFGRVMVRLFKYVSIEQSLECPLPPYGTTTRKILIVSQFNRNGLALLHCVIHITVETAARIVARRTAPSV